jgi:hypothetical protein
MDLHLDRRAADLAERVANYPGDHLLTDAELAAWLAVSTGSLKAWRRRGNAPRSTFIGKERGRRTLKSDLLDWLRERTKASA